MDKEFKIRVVKKTKENVTLNFGPKIGNKTFSWEEFNSMYTIKDNVWAYPSEEALANLKEVDELISEAVMAFFMANGNNPSTKLTGMAMLSQTFEKIQEKTGWSNMECISIVRNRLDAFNNSLEKEKRKARVYEYKERRKERMNVRSDQERFEKRELATTTLGDIPALQALKEKFAK